MVKLVKASLIKSGKENSNGKANDRKQKTYR